VDAVKYALIALAGALLLWWRLSRIQHDHDDETAEPLLRSAPTNWLPGFRNCTRCRRRDRRFRALAARRLNRGT
jgi:hypothetical protein